MLLAVTTGGRLGELATEWSIPSVRFAYDAQPRATLGYLLTPLISIFAQLGFLPSKSLPCSRPSQQRVRRVNPLPDNSHQ